MTDHDWRDPADPLGRIAGLTVHDAMRAPSPGPAEYEKHWLSHYTGVAVGLTTREVRERLAGAGRLLAEDARRPGVPHPYRAPKLRSEIDAYRGELARRGDSTAEETTP